MTRWWTTLEDWLRIAGLGRVTFIALLATYVVGWVVSPLVVPYGPTDLDLFFWPAAQTAAAGHVLTVYSVHGLDAYPNANGPLGLLPLVPMALVSNALRLPDSAPVNAALVDGILAVSALLMAREATLIVAAARGSVRWRLAATVVFILTPALIVAGGDYGHIEQPIAVWLVLLGVRAHLGGRVLIAGALLGLAALTRTTSLVAVAPLMLIVVSRRRWRSARSMGTGFAGAVAVGLAPFIAADARDVVHSLLTFRGSLPIGYGSLWSAARDTSWSSLGQHGDVYIIAAFVVVSCGALLLLRPALAASAAGVCGLLAIASLSFPMLSKTVFPYYFVEPSIFCTIWWLTRPGRLFDWRVLAPAVVIGDTFLARWAVTHPPGAAAAVEGTLSSALLAAVAVMIAADLLHRLGARAVREDVRVASDRAPGTTVRPSMVAK